MHQVYCFPNDFVYIRIAVGIPPATDEELRLESATPFSRCYMYDVNYTELMEQGIKRANLSWPIIQCKQGWTFNHTMIPYASIAAEVIKTALSLAMNHRRS